MSDHKRLTFINVSGSSSRDIGKDAATKSEVRSQVMKNLRRKQRLDDQKSTSSHSLAPALLTLSQSSRRLGPFQLANTS
jgi:hypothetical protein